MFIGTHACLPVIVAGLIDWKRVRRNLSPLFSRLNLLLIAIGGIFPDLFSIHLSLAARHSSMTHTIWFPIMLTPLFLIFGFRRFREFFFTGFIMWVGVALHLFCDMISGGIPLWGTENLIVGKYYVSPILWLPLDCISLLIVWYIFFSIKFIVSKGTLVSPTCSWEEKILEVWRKTNKM